MTPLSWTARRLVRAVRLWPSLFRHHSDSREASSFELDIATGAGREVREALRRLGEQVVEDRWSVVETDTSPATIRFARADEALALRIEPKSERSFADTRYFSIIYQGSRELGEDAEALVRRCVDAVTVAEQDVKWRDLVRRPTLSRISYYPASQRVEVRPSLVCNHSCGFCNSVDRTGTDNVARGIDDVISNIDAIDELPVTVAAISGGEPTLQSRLPDLIRAFASRGITVELQTNGMALADPACTRSLRRAGLRRAVISLHSARPDESDQGITLFEGAWEKTVAGIDQALAAGIAVDLSHVIHTSNAGQTREFLEFVDRRWRRRLGVRMAFVAPTGAAREAARSYVPPLENILPSLLEALAFARERRLRVNFVGYCGIPPCLLQPEHAHSDIVRLKGARSYNDNHVQLDACKECQYQPRCPGLWAKYVELHGDPGLTPM